MQLDPNILALLSGSIQKRVGMDGRPMLPSFSGGEGMNPNLLAMLAASGQMPMHLDTGGNPILPNAPGASQAPQFKGLDAYQRLQQGEGSKLMVPQTQPSASMLPMGFNNQSLPVGQQQQHMKGAMQAGMNPTLFPGMFGPIGGMGQAIGAFGQMGRTQGQTGAFNPKKKVY